jgi:hypothetical protein
VDARLRLGGNDILEHERPFTVSQRVGMVASYSYSETVKPKNMLRVAQG